MLLVIIAIGCTYSWLTVGPCADGTRLWEIPDPIHMSVASCGLPPQLAQH